MLTGLLCLQGLAVAETPAFRLVGWGANETGQVDAPVDLVSVVAVAGGLGHTLALEADGVVRAWGDNTKGQAGVPVDLADAIAIAAGDNHSLAVRSNGAVVGWGDDSANQLTVPEWVTNLIAVSAGRAHNIGLRADRVVVCWGDQSAGQWLIRTPASNAVAVAAGGNHSVALLAGGWVTNWGRISLTPVEATRQTNLVAVACGSDHVLALRADGRVFGWGSNTFGQIAIPEFSVPIVAVAAGGNHSLALGSDGSVFAWGADDKGQIDLPALLTNVVAVAAGAKHSFAITGEAAAPHVAAGPWPMRATLGGSVLLSAKVLGALPMHYQWLFNGQPLPGATNPALRLSGMALPQAGGYQMVVGNTFGAATSTVARVDFGPVIVWGYAKSNPLAPPADLQDVVAIGAGKDHCTALDSRGRLRSWGRWFPEVPASVDDVTAFAVTRLSSYATTGGILALHRDGTVTGWGQGELITKLPNLTNVVAISADGRGAALRGNGTVTSWGATVSYETDNAIGVSAGYPGAVALRGDGRVVELFTSWGSRFASISNAVAVVTASDRRLGLRDDGTVAMWGKGTCVTSAVPDSVTNVVAVDACGCVNAALRNDGTVVLWGDPSWPCTPPEGLSNVVAISLGGNHAMALVAEAMPPLIRQQPLPQAAGAEEGAGFRIDAVGSLPMLYQWYRDGVPIPGATNAWYRLPLVLEDHLGEYSAAVSNRFGSAMSTGASLRLNPVVVWGSPTSSPGGDLATPATLADVVEIRAGISVDQAYMRDGTMLTWGDPNSAPTAGVRSTNSVGVIATTRGTAHTLTLTSDGRVTASGRNTSGQCTVPLDLDDVVAIAATWNASLALRGDGSLVVWGEYARVPPEATNLIAISYSNDFLGLRADGSVVSWSWLGTPRAPVPPDLGRAVAITSGTMFSVALLENGTVRAWGYDNSRGQLDAPAGLTGVTQISASMFHTLALRASRQAPIILQQPTARRAWVNGPMSLGVRATGSVPLRYQWQFKHQDLVGATNWFMHLDRVSEADAGDYSVEIANDFGSLVSSNATVTVGSSVPLVLTPAVERGVCPGENRTLVVDTDGPKPMRLQWYRNGEVVEGATNQTLALTALYGEQTGDYSVEVVNAFGTNSAEIARLTMVPVATWGSSESGLANLPVTLTNTVALAGGGAHSVALRADGTIVAWGSNDRGQASVPADLTDAKAIACGLSHTLALRQDGTVAAWGMNNDGQCNVPTNLPPVTAIAAGAVISLALTETGTLVAWGSSYGTGTNLGTNILAVSARNHHVLAATRDRQLAAWGSYFPGSVTDLLPPLSNVVAVAAGSSHGMALTEDGQVLAWGANVYGQTNVPVLPGRVKAIAASDSHCLALTEAGQVVGWGGGADWWAANTPPAARNAKAIAAGSSHFLALIASLDAPPRLAVRVLGDRLELELRAPTGRECRIEYAARLGRDTTWETLANLVITNGTHVLTEPWPAGQSARFFRAVSTP